MRSRITAAALWLSFFALLTPWAGAQTAAPTVHIKNFKFVPATLTIKAGTTVTFVNDDTDAHTATATDKTFDSGGLDTSEGWSHKFTTPGTYSYFCAVHPYMKGVVTVTAP
jgi:plastocyanin